MARAHIKGGLRRRGGNNYVDLSLFVLLYNIVHTNFMKKLEFNYLKKWLNKKLLLTVHIFYNLQSHHTFHSEERLVNLLSRRECLVGLSMLLIYMLCMIIRW